MKHCIATFADTLYLNEGMKLMDLISHRKIKPACLNALQAYVYVESAQGKF